MNKLAPHHSLDNNFWLQNLTCASYSLFTAIPVFSTKAGKYQAYTDSSTTLHCLVTGLPSLNITWYRNGIPLLDSSDSHAVLKNNSVTLNDLNWEDNGLFQCGAENYAGLFFVNQQLQVQSKAFYSFFFVRLGAE